MTIPGGYILLSRKLIESEIYDKPPLYLKVWIYLLSKAQHKKHKKLERGQLFTKIPEIQEACSWYVGFRKETPSKSKIYRIIDWMRKASEQNTTETTNGKMIETTKATQGMVVEVCNYGHYQDPKNYERNADRNDEKTMNKQRTEQHRNNINKNVKNVEECIKNDNHDASVDERKILKILNSINKYPFDFEKDLKHIRKLMTKHPEVDILEEIDKWETWLIDNPLKKKSNPRLQITNWMKNASEGRYNNSNNDDKKVDERTVDYDEIRELMKDE